MLFETVEDYMTKFLRAGVCVAVAAISGGTEAATPAQAVSDVSFASHRAVYDLKLRGSKGQNGVQSARGRIVYDFSGTPCEGYALQFRQVTELDSGEGRVVVSDLRSSTWEDDTAKQFTYLFENILDSKVVGSVDGSAARDGEKVAARLKKPKDRQLDLGNVIFPTDHIRRIIRAGESGQKVLEAKVYDGSDNGEKIYDTLTVIGQKIAPGERLPNDAAAGKDVLANLARWPVTISYFDAGKSGGEQTPVYSISFELYENGVSRALVLDYGDFTLTGEMTSFEATPSKSCN